jgi:hypothetical protein
VRTAAAIKSVCRHRKAGICSTSTAAAASGTCSSVWTSVSTGTCNSRRILASTATHQEARPAKSPARRPIGLVEAGLENIIHAQGAAGLAQRSGHLETKRFIFDHARAGDQSQLL